MVTLPQGPGLSIAGERRTAARTLAVIDPATASPFIEVPCAEAADVTAAVAAAAAAAPDWAAVPVAERGAAVTALAEVIADHLDELADLLTHEQGKPLDRARGEIESGIRFLTTVTGFELADEVLRSGPDEEIVLQRVPVGVVGAITAWNYPMLLAAWKLGPALYAGNPVVLKPSPYTPVATLRLGELAQSVLPPGVVQVLSGDDRTGQALVADERVRKISFTGSQRAGRAIMTASGPSLKRLTLELGGNDAGLVLPDAEPSAFAEELFWGAFSNCGQVCAGLKRLYVPQDRLAEYAEALAEVAAGVVVGPGTQPGVDIGPVQNRPQLERVRTLLADSVADGAEVAYSGPIPDRPGYWHPVTVVVAHDDSQPIVAEEQFGPVLPVLGYGTVDEAVERANSTSFGLGSSVWSPDEEQATAVADRLVAGTVWVNQHPMLSADVPFGGVRQSGIGVESSRAGLLAYTDTRVRRVRHRG